MKNISLFTKMMKTVSSLPWLKKAFEIEKITSKIATSKITKNKVFEKKSYSDTAGALPDLTESEFKKLIHKIFKLRGYTLIDDAELSHDDVDLVLQQDNETTYVQYDHWKDKQIELSTITSLHNNMTDDNVRFGIVITSGEFTSDALEFALGKTILLINGIDLSQMIEVLMQSNFEEEELDTKNASEELKMPELEPLCPICSQKMIKRTARKGKNAGNIFWGCSQFPNCRGVVSE